MSIKTEICGIQFDSCIMNASGCHCVTEKELNELMESKSGAVVSKSGTIEVRNGNPEPRLHIDKIGSINSMGLPNLSFEFYSQYGNNVSDINIKPFIQSIHPFSVDELDIMLNSIDKINKKRLIELNVTCPNIMSTNANASASFESFEKYMDKIKQSKLNNAIVGMKLSPIYELNHFDIMSRLLLKYDIKFVTCINSLINGLIVDPYSETTRIYQKMD